MRGSSQAVPEDRRRLLLLHRQEGPGRPQHQRQGQPAEDPEVHGQGRMHGGHRDAHGRARDRAERPRGVEPRHDRAAQLALDLGALDVHRDVPEAGADAVEEQPDRAGRRRPGRTRAEPGQQQPHRRADRAGPDDGARRGALDQRAGGRQRQHRPGRDGEQEQAEGAVVEREPFPEVRDPGDQGGEQEAVERERSRDRVAGRQLGRRGQRDQSVPGGRASSQAWNPVSDSRLIASSTSTPRALAVDDQVVGVEHRALRALGLTHGVVGEPGPVPGPLRAAAPA